MGLGTRVLECFGVRAVVRLDDVIDFTSCKDPDDLRTVDFSIAAGCTAVAIFPCGSEEGQ